MNTGALSLFHNVLTHNGEIIEYWKNKSTKNSKLNIIEKNLGMLLILLESLQWVDLTKIISTKKNKKKKKKKKNKKKKQKLKSVNDIEFWIIWSLGIQFLFPKSFLEI
jgi:hypothetical protein